MYLELCFVSANKTLQKYLVPVKLLDFPNLNKNAEFLGLKFNIDSADDRLCNCNHRKMFHRLFCLNSVVILEELVARIYTICFLTEIITCRLKSEKFNPWTQKKGRAKN